MPKPAPTIKITLDPETDRVLGEWKDTEGRSKQGQAAYLLRRLAAIRQQAPGELARLGLAVPALAAN